MPDTAIVTLAIGQQHLSYWQKNCEPTWRAYAQKHQYDVIVVDQPLDPSPAAAARSVAWQKCLVLGQDFAARYSQIILLDSDIVINVDAAPPVTDQAPPASIGGVISGSHIHDDLRIVLLSRLRGQPIEYERGLRLWSDDQAQYYRHYGLAPLAAGIVQTGVLVLSPQHHRPLLESVYYASFKAPFKEHRSYEQIPLSHAILSSGLFCPLDTRFNCVLLESLLVHYPYLLNKQIEIYDALAMCAVQTEFTNNFFLHFAYEPDFIRYLAPHTRRE